MIDEVIRGYTFDGPAVDLGALVVDGESRPEARIRLPLGMFNRHGLVAGATGTGKTKTLQLMAEQLSAAGVPVFLADVKGDLSGMATPGDASAGLMARAAETGQIWSPRACPTEFYSLGGIGEGIPIRATMTSFGPTLLAKVLGLNDTQESSLGLIFHFADGHALPLLDLKDLRAVIQHLIDHPDALKGLGGLSRQSAGVILRALTNAEAEGADQFFGEPEYETADLMRVLPDDTGQGRGVVSILELPAVQDRPAMFSTFLMWLVADLFSGMPEVGDLDRPRLVFFLDEAHLLFADASKEFLRSITQTVRLIRSKGVGVFFVTQTPEDVPADVLAQLGARVQHALRAFTPQDAKALRATVSTFPRSEYDLEELLTQLGIGEAVVTALSDRGVPTPVAWTRLHAPQSRMGPSDPAVVQRIVAASPLRPRYAQAIDRRSAYEILASRVVVPTEEPAKSPAEPAARAERPMWETVLGTFARAAAGPLGREISRSIFGTARRRR